MSEQGMQDFRAKVDVYLEGLRAAYGDGGGTEHSGRTALEGFLKGCAEEHGKDIVIQQEPEQVKGKAPDFKISRNGIVIGYVETKKLGMDCEEVAASEQIERYKTLNKNILITNYHDFYWLESDKPTALFFKQDILNAEKKFYLRDDNLKLLKENLTGFFGVAYEKIGSAKDLAEKLAIPCRSLRDALKRSLEKQESKEIERDRIFGIYEGFTKKISSEMTISEFADAFAQTLGYGTLLARLNNEGQEEITLDNAKNFIPDSFTLIGELVRFIDELKEEPYREIGWIVEAILSVVNNLNLCEIKQSLNYYKASTEEEKELYEKDPFIYFYENFLNAYDPQQRKQRGVYYTPAPVVNFIVRGIDDMLKDKFDLHTGLADSRVTALDFACGTGTFLLETMKQIFHNSDKNLARKVLDEHICQNIFGFEYLVAAYTVAHLKLSQYLSKEGIPLGKQQRLKIYLANTLENFNMSELEDNEDYILRRLNEEGKEAQKIKDKDILVIMGNPPYAGHSLNKGAWISEKIERYKYIDGKPLEENFSKWLQDDYVKFICFAEEKMMKAKEGIVGIITNHSFLDNITFQGMRNSLLQTFDQIYVLDLHGNSRRKIVSPTGVKDENIFDIMQGVSISFFIKKPGIEKKFCHAEIWGSRETKYRTSVRSTYKGIEWTNLKNSTAPYLFKPFNSSLHEIYKSFWGITDIFLENSTGIVTKRDSLAFQFKKRDLENIIRHLLTLTPAQIREEYSDCNWDSRDGKAEFVYDSLKKIGYNKDLFKKCLYRPFDNRWTYYNKKSKGLIGWPVYDIMRHMIRGKNLALISVKQIAEKIYNHAFITETITESRITLSNKGVAYLFPLYLYAPDKDGKLPKNMKEVYGVTNPFVKKEVIENIYPDFRKEINKKYNEIFTAEKIFFYIYAILHSPYYREKYQEFLRIEFPRIPFPDDKESFLKLSILGEQLKQAHLLEKIPNLPISYEGEGDDKITKIIYFDKKLHINPNQFFTPIEPEVWNFHIGGYQVLKKYLQERKKRKLPFLSWDEIEHVKKIVASLTATRTLMERIDPIAQKFL